MKPININKFSKKSRCRAQQVTHNDMRGPMRLWDIMEMDVDA